MLFSAKAKCDANSLFVALILLCEVENEAAVEKWLVKEDCVIIYKVCTYVVTDYKVLLMCTYWSGRRTVLHVICVIISYGPLRLGYMYSVHNGTCIARTGYGVILTYFTCLHTCGNTPYLQFHIRIFQFVS